MPFDLDTVLLDLSTADYQSHWTIRNAIEGVQIFGGIGSGKTSGSGRMIALKYLQHKFGGLVLTAKHSERALWEGYCELTGRTEDLIIIGPESEHRFNFLEYESVQKGMNKSFTTNIVEVLKTVISAGDEQSGGGKDDKFWDTSLHMLLTNIIDLCLLAYGKVTVKLMQEIMLSAPKQGQPEVPDKDPKPKPGEPPVEIKRTPYRNAHQAAYRVIENLIHEWLGKMTKAERDIIRRDATFDLRVAAKFPEVRTFQNLKRYFQDSYKNINGKTRAIIDYILQGFLDNLLREPVYSIFCQGTSTFTPEVCLDGKIILLDLPVKDYFKAGRDTQIMFKYIWQRAMERRRTKENNEDTEDNKDQEDDKDQKTDKTALPNDRPVFLWADEAQNFLHEHDADYQATARSSIISTVYLSQNLPNYYANMGGSSNRSEYKVKSFLGTLATKIFHANADVDTNQYASSLIGEDYFLEESSSYSMAGSYSSSKTEGLKLHKLVRPELFPALLTGGPKNEYEVEAYMHVQGNALAPNANYRKVSFDQNFIPQSQKPDTNE